MLGRRSPAPTITIRSLMRIAPTVALVTLLSPFALLPRGPMTPTEAQSQAQAPRPTAASGAMQVLRLDPALDHLLNPHFTPELVAGPFVFTEGPMWRGGKLWFVDEEGDKIH